MRLIPGLLTAVKHRDTFVGFHYRPTKNPYRSGIRKGRVRCDPARSSKGGALLLVRRSHG
jgi:hypothetical protein